MDKPATRTKSYSVTSRRHADTFTGNIKVSTSRKSKSLHSFLLFSGVSEHRFLSSLLFGATDLQMSGSSAQSCLQEHSKRLRMRVEPKTFGSTPRRPSVQELICTPTRQNNRKHEQFWEDTEKNLNVKIPAQLKTHWTWLSRLCLIPLFRKCQSCEPLLSFSSPKYSIRNQNICYPFKQTSTLTQAVQEKPKSGETNALWRRRLHDISHRDVDVRFFKRCTFQPADRKWCICQRST